MPRKQGKVKPLSARQVKWVFEKNIDNPYRLFLQFLWYTQLPAIDVLRLTIDQVFDQGVPRDTIQFSKKRNKVLNPPINVTIVGELQLALKAFNPPDQGFLFPSRSEVDQSLNFDTVKYWFSQTFPELVQAGYSLSSFSVGGRAQVERVSQSFEVIDRALSLEHVPETQDLVNFPDHMSMHSTALFNWRRMHQTIPVE